VYQNTQPAGSLWYHDHALGVTRLNVYAGLVGFYFIRDEYDTGKYDNPINLPAYPYEAAFAIQDRMFKENGELFFPAFEGDPGYADFIDADIQKKLPNQHGPSVLTEFFGDHMVVNGKIWPKMKVEPRKYRLRLLNGCDSRFLLLQFVAVDSFMTEIPSDPVWVPFTVIGSDQGLAKCGDWTNIGNGTSDFLVFDPGARYDIIVDFRGYDNKRIIMRNIGADSPYKGELDGDYFENRRTDRIMAFDVVNPLQIDVPERDIENPPTSNVRVVDLVEQQLKAYAATNRSLIDKPRRVSLFEGQDKYGRLQPMMGPVLASEVQWPSTQLYEDAGLVGGIEGAVAWHTPTPETIACNTIETWEIWNPTADAHPIHLHLVHFHVLERYKIKWDSNADAEGTLEDGAFPRGDGTYLVPQKLVEHTSKVGDDPSTFGHGFRVMNPMRENVTVTDLVGHHFIGGRRDTVVALPGQVTTIRMIFDRPGRYIWHCHILSHEDHNMMHVVQVQGPCN
jgi:spore coat protein A, manganese oxidase